MATPTLVQTITHDRPGDWPTHIHGLARWVRKVRLVEPEWREATP